jgi:hypothetical protein
MFKVIVAGGRNFSDYDLLSSTLHRLISKKCEVEIVSGMARGADSLALRFANENNLVVKKFPANWDRHGNSAGYKRNVQMAEYADACVCFWDGESKGTADMIRVARVYGLQIRVIKY